MPFRKALKAYKDRFKETTRRILGDSTSAQSSDSLPHAQTISPITNPVPSTSAIPAIFGSLKRPTSAPPRGGAAGLNHTWKCLKGFVQTLDAGSSMFEPLKRVIDELVQCFVLHENAAAPRRDYAALKAQLEAVFRDLSQHFSGNVPPAFAMIMENICGAIERELDCIANKEESQAWRRHFEAKKDLNEVLDCYRRIHGHLDRLNLNANANTWKTVDEIATEARLRTLNPSMSARYNSAQATEIGRRSCTPKTREQVLTDLSFWRHDKQQGNIFWVNGMAGTGKTTIANTLCAMLDQSHELGASFFCTRLLPECRDVKRILPSIAYQLARFSRPFRFALSQSLERDPDIHTLALPNQLEGLITGPLREVAHTLPNDLVVVIDALDECEDSNGVGQMLEMLANHAAGFPIKIFVSSRPEPEIRERIGDIESKIILHELDDKIVKEDIKTYLRVELEYISLAESELAALVERAGVLFIYAATVVRYIGAETSRIGRKERLESVLAASAPASSNRYRNIDVLYGTVLDYAFDNSDLEDEQKSRMKLVLDTVICAQEPLTLDALAGLLQLGDSEWVHAALRPFWSVLHISGANHLVTTLHASFPDYMLNPKRSNDHFCDATSRHGKLTERCLARIENNKQQFNICKLESSYVPDEQVPDLEERIKDAVPIDLLYACQHWAAHLELGRWSANRTQLLEGFLSKRLLLWMEVLNLKKRMNMGAVSLEKARKWCTNGSDSGGIVGLIHDAWRFVTTFATSTVSRSTPHIYVSMLASWPSSELITDCYVKRARGLAEVKGNGMKRRQLALLGVFDVRRIVWSVALSPDGTRIICGCIDGTIRVWDAQSGKEVLGSFEGHADWVSSVALSPDGQHIASGSWDRTVRVWDARRGRELRTLEGHTDKVTSVAFSPDSARLVSGSGDTTVRVWDLQSGKPVGLLKGHTQGVRTVAFSPDGMRIVSGSGDNTILVWYSQTGQVALGPLEGHTGWVNSVAFSPDGNRFVSGGDRTIRVWDARNGKPILKPLEGHTGPVNSVAFSPDGSHIISGSNDHSIRLWDARRGNVVLGPLEGHTLEVASVAFSPDGMRIVSGSHDQTVRVWDAQIRDMAPEPFEGHTDSVNSVAFSPDGTLIVSGSADRSIRVWDAQNGNKVTGALMGHTDGVASVAFSPDSLHVVSGSSDNTLRLCDVRNEKVVLRPLEGHTDPILSVAFSPDGIHIVSGSHDKTIRMWDARSGKMVLGPLKGHTGDITSVAFSPNGLFIVSGSYDRTLRVWDAQNGQIVLDPLRGHTEWVRSVAFSPNDMTIVSGSVDSTLRVWDAQSGNRVLGPLKGHTGEVSSVAFSPDGVYIISGSSDKTIRVWVAETGELVLGPLNGHTLPVRSVAFSPDSTHIVSGSDDKAIRVWRLPSQLTAKSDPRSPATSCSHAVADSPIPQPGFFHQAPGNILLPWVLDMDGWVVDKYGHLLLWVPLDLRTSLMTPMNPFLISPRGSIELNFESAAIGELWADCYTPS